MSIAICGIVNDGIVLGTDSTATSRFQDGKVQTFRDQTKLFRLHPQLPVAAAVIGLADVGGATIPNLMFDVQQRLSGARRDTAVEPLDASDYTIEQIVDAVKIVLFDEHYLPLAAEMPPQHPLVVYLAGYASGSTQPVLVEITFQKEHVIGPHFARPKNTAHLSLGGTYEAAIRLNMGYSLRLPDVLVELDLIEEEQKSETRKRIQEKLYTPLLLPGTPLAEAARVVEFLIDAEIKFSYFTPEPDLVGGAIQPATISPRHGFRWVHRPH